MAAATVTLPKVVRSGPMDVVMEFDVTVMTPSQIEVISHGGPDGVKPSHIECLTAERSAAGDFVLMEHIEASDDLTNNTASLRFLPSAGGNLTDARARVRVNFASHKSGGLVTA